MSSNNYDIEYLKKYHRGELSSREMFLLEKEAEQDPLLMDLLLGLEAENPATHDKNLDDIHSKIDDRIEKRKVVKIINWQLISIAASIIVLMGVSFFLLKDNLTEKTIIAQAPVEHRIPKISVAPTDSSTHEVNFGAEDSALVAQIPQQQKKNSSRNTELTPEKIDQQLAIRDLLNKRLEESRDRLAKIGTSSRLRNFSVDDNQIASLNSAPVHAEMMIANEMGKNSQLMIRGIAPQKKNTIGGVILDKEDGKPIVGAVIKNLDENTITTSDSIGRFTVQTDKKDIRLEALAIGYEKKNLIASQPHQQIKLNSANNEIEEVVVVGFGTQAKRAVVGSTIKINDKKPILSEPIVGWQSYQKYIKEATKLAKVSKTEVYLQFDIDNEGKPFNFRINQSGGPIADQRSVDIVRNGPDWKKGSSNTPVELKLEY